MKRETQIFSYYYGRLERDEEGHKLAPDNDAGKQEAIERTLTEMHRTVEQNTALLEREDIAHSVISLDEAAGRGYVLGDEEDHLFTYDAYDHEAGDEPDDLDGPEYEYTPEEAYGERAADGAAWQFNTAARKVNLGVERLRFPSGLTTATREWLIEIKLPKIDRRIENGAGFLDKKDKYGAVQEKGILSDIDRLIRPERDEMLRRLARSTGIVGDASQVHAAGPGELAEAGRVLLELCIHDRREMERRRELRSRLEITDKLVTIEGNVNAAADRSYIFNDNTASRLGRVERLIDGLRKNLIEAHADRESASRSETGLYVSLSNDRDAPRLPVSNIRVYDTIERMATGAQLNLSVWDGKSGAALINGFTEQEYDTREKVAGFLKSYAHERLSDPETRLLHESEIFRNAHKALERACTPEELNRTAHDLMSRNERQGRPLGERERRLLFHGRVPGHYTPEMVELRLTWGLTRDGREQSFRDGRLPPSPTLKAMLNELETRHNVESVRQYQKALTTPPEQMRNRGSLPLYQMHKQLLGHERDYLYHLAEERKQFLPGRERPTRATAKPREAGATGRAFGAVPHESKSYKEYITSLGEIKQRLHDEAHSRSTNGKHPISLVEQNELHNRACNLAWERLATAEVFISQPSEPALRLSETIAKLQEEAQPRARLAAQALVEFSKENVLSYANGRVPKDALDALDPAKRERYEQLKDYANRIVEELYRGFESIDGLREEMEKSRAKERMNDRVALGNAIVAEAQYECARLDYETARDHGETFRFRIRDESRRVNRRISAFDIERRAGARGTRAADEHGAEHAEERRNIRQEVSSLDLANHTETLREHSKVHGNLVNKLRTEAGMAASARLQAQEQSQAVARKYQERGEQLPVPFINRKTLTGTQEQTIRRGLAAHTETLEEIRIAQSQEFKRSANQLTRRKHRK